MKPYTLVTVWRIRAPLEMVWGVLSRPERWPTWWPYVKRVEMLSPGNPKTGIGLVHRHHWSTCLPYGLRFELEALEIKPFTHVRTRVSGDLVGVGWCRTRASGPVTLIRFDWHVHTVPRWMNVLSPLARPVFLWNHQRVMAAGERALRGLLAPPGLSSSTVSPPASSNKEFGTPLRQNK